MSNPDTRVALVREDAASKRVKKALLSAKEDAFLSIDAQVDAILAELFPKTDKPLTDGDLRLGVHALRFFDDNFAQQPYQPTPRDTDAAARIEEELNRG